MTLETAPLRDLTRKEQSAVADAIDRYLAFVGS
jgi:hypothetical protein